MELERRELQAAPGAGKGRVELGFLEEQRKLCPFLEVTEAGHQEQRVDAAAGSCCQVKDPLSSRTQTLETPYLYHRTSTAPGRAFGAQAELCCSPLCLV